MSDDAIGKRIETVRLNDNELQLVFVDGSTLSLADEGQYCCEHRYLTCDDDLPSFTGETFVRWEVSGMEERAGGDVHEVHFLRIQLGSGSMIVVESHNEHNGYYGGVSVRARYTP